MFSSGPDVPDDEQAPGGDSNDGEPFDLNSGLFFAFSSLFVNQHNVADFSSAFSDKHLAVGRPSKTKNRLGCKIR
jgi:hypothetical protein